MWLDDIITYMTKIELITDQRALVQRINAAKKSKWIAVDTEFLREKTYYPLLCLVQCKTESGEYCIDVLAIDDLSPLQDVFSDLDIIKIFHSCRQDLEALDQRLDESICNLNDTQIAAAFCGYGGQISYAALVESICHISLAKSHTRADWSARPLSHAQLQYAVDDVSFLNTLREFLETRLSKFGRQDWFRDECERILNLRDYRINPQDAWMRLKGGEKIPARFQQSAKALSIWRESRAQQRDRPREWILSTQALTEIAIQQPANLAALSEIKAVNPGLIGNSGESILQILRSNTSPGDPVPVWKKFVPLDSEQRKRVRR